MIRRRVAYVLAGVCAFAVAVAEISVGVLPVSLDRAVVYVVGAAALYLAYRVARRRWFDGPTEAETPDPELAPETAVPGSDLLAALESVPDVRSHFRRSHRESLHDVAVQTLVRYTGASEADAVEAVRRGEWTDDPVAARFVGEASDPPTLRSRARRYLRVESEFDQGVRQTIAAITRIAGTGTPTRARTQAGTLLDWLRPVEGPSARTVRPPEEADDETSGDGGAASESGESRATGRWRGAGALALVCVAIGVFYELPGVVLAGVVVVGAVAYGRTSTAPPLDLSVERTVDDRRPDAGEAVEVTVTARNESDSIVPDLRLIDGVPPALEVATGSPRLATALAPGETATVSYAVRARRGVHEFGPTMAIGRDLAGTAERVRYLDGPGDTAAAARVTRPPAELADREATAAADEADAAGDRTPGVTASGDGGRITGADDGDSEQITGADDGQFTGVDDVDDEGLTDAPTDRGASGGRPRGAKRGVNPRAGALVCRPQYAETVEDVPLRRHPAQGNGPVTTDIGGAGVEFYATREYRPGDPLNRIDWNRLARTGNVATTDFREERVATVVLLVDARANAYCSPGTDDHALDRAVDAAGRMGHRLLDDGHRVGLATLGSGDCWLEPGADRDQWNRLRDALSTHESLSPLPDPDRRDPSRRGASSVGKRDAGLAADPEWRRRLQRRLPRGAQLLACTPLVDWDAVRLLRAFEARGYPSTVVSPDPTTADTPGQAVARLGRRFRISDLRRDGVPVVDWEWSGSLDATLGRYAEARR